jgi:hypothetical protein
MQRSRQGENPYLNSRNIHSLFSQLVQRLGLNASDPSVQQRYKQTIFDSVNALYARDGGRHSLAEFNKHCLDGCIREINNRRQQISPQQQRAPGGRRMGESEVSDASRRREAQSAAGRAPMAPPQRPRVAGMQDGFAPSGSGGGGGGAPLIANIQGNRPYITATGEMGSEMYMGPVDDDNLDQKTIDALTRGRPTGSQAPMDYTVGPNGRPIQKLNFSLVGARHQGSGSQGQQYDPSGGMGGAMGGMMPPGGGMGGMMPPGGGMDPGFNFDAMGGDPFASFGMGGQQLPGVGSGNSGMSQQMGMGGGGNFSSKKQSDIDNRLNKMMLDRARVDAETDQPIATTRANMGMGSQQGNNEYSGTQQTMPGMPQVNPTTMNPMQAMQQQMGQMAQVGAQLGIGQNTSQQQGQFGQMHPMQQGQYGQPQMQQGQYGQPQMQQGQYGQPQMQQGQYGQPQMQQGQYGQPQMQPFFLKEGQQAGLSTIPEGGVAPSGTKESIQIEAMRLMKKKLTKRAIALKKMEQRIQAQLVEQNKREIQGEIDRSRKPHAISRDVSPPHAIGTGRGRERSPSPQPIIEVVIDCSKVTEPRYYNDYTYQFTKPHRGIRTIRLVEYSLNRRKPRVTVPLTSIRFEHNSQWTTAVVAAGEYTEEHFLQEMESQMGADVYKVGRDERSGNIFIKRLDGRKFRIDTLNNILNRLGFQSKDREEGIMFIAEATSTFSNAEWYLYVEDQNMGALDNRSDPIPLQFSEPEDIQVLKIQIRDHTGKIVDVNGSSHKLIFEFDTQ